MKGIAYAGVLLALIAVAAASKPIADLLFVLSADKASFPSTGTLQLKGVTTTVQFYGAGAKAGVISTPTFANGSAGAGYVASNGE
ncbi:hypothetical protein WJX75_000045 [Coccomyxa subellipsoidea]|uniref:Uncharacterized protein n=1 Tax=Coccomyxa subellipsoidea TaxID=248742 RepID=A0ABR2YV13_9CHLO